jgi:HPt (histidine-containing phosphotransfer) domain-containing protein
VRKVARDGGHTGDGAAVTSGASKLEAAAKRLELAVARLERAVGQTGGGAEARKLAAALSEAKRDYSVLEQTTSRVAARLDATIERLNAVLRN